MMMHSETKTVGGKSVFRVCKDNNVKKETETKEVILILILLYKRLNQDLTRNLLKIKDI